MSVGIRRLGPDDAIAYRELRLRGLREHPDAFTSSFEEESARPVTALSRRLDLAPDADERVFGAFTDQTLVGVAGLAREARSKNRHKATLFGMYVAGEVGGRGIGRTLLMHALDDARSQAGLVRIVLTVTKGNRAARELYAAVGFQSFGIEPMAIRVGDAWYAKEHMGITLGKAGTPASPAEAGREP